MESTRVAGADVQITGTLDMRGNRITGMSDDIAAYPSAKSDGATKAYVDSQRAAVENLLPVEVNNGTF